MPKKFTFPQSETEIADIQPGFNADLVDEKYDGVYMIVTKKDGSQHTRKHQRQCDWD